MVGSASVIIPCKAPDSGEPNRNTELPRPLPPLANSDCRVFSGSYGAGADRPFGCHAFVTKDG